MRSMHDFDRFSQPTSRERMTREEAQAVLDYANYRRGLRNSAVPPANTAVEHGDEGHEYDADWGTEQRPLAR